VSPKRRPRDYNHAGARKKMSKKYVSEDVRELVEERGMGAREVCLRRPVCERQVAPPAPKQRPPEYRTHIGLHTPLSIPHDTTHRLTYLASINSHLILFSLMDFHAKRVI
jgi:hypothetical protein